MIEVENFLNISFEAENILYAAHAFLRRFGGHSNLINSSEKFCVALDKYADESQNDTSRIGIVVYFA